MLKLIACSCGGVEPLLKQLLQECNTPGWMEIPVHMGKEHSQTILSYFPNAVKESLDYRALTQFIENASRYAVVIGYDDKRFYWENVASKAPVEVARAKAIIKEFA